MFSSQFKIMNGNCLNANFETVLNAYIAYKAKQMQETEQVSDILTIDQSLLFRVCTGQYYV